MRRINLIDPGANKIAVISTIRNSTNLSLKEAKDLVDRVPSSFEVEDSVAQELIGRLRSKGAVVQSESDSIAANGLGTAETSLINSRTELTTSPQTGRKDNKLASRNRGVYRIFGEEFGVTQGMKNYLQYLRYADIHREDYVNTFVREYSSIYPSPENWADKTADKIRKQIEAAAESVQKYVMAYGFYTTSAEDFFDQDANDALIDCMASIQEEMLDIIEQGDDEKAYRAARKANRARAVGFGFGLGGYIKGSLEAGAINAATGLGHSLANAIGNSNTTRETKARLNEVIRNKKTESALAERLRYCIANMYSKAMWYLRNNGIEFDVPDFKKSDNILQNYSQIPKSRKPQALLEAIRCNYLCQEAYQLILNEFPQEFPGVDGVTSELGMDFSGPIVAKFNEALTKWQIKYNDSRHFELQPLKKVKELVNLFEELDEAVTVCDWSDELKQKRIPNYFKVSRLYNEISTTYQGEKFASQSQLFDSLEELEQFYSDIIGKDLTDVRVANTVETTFGNYPGLSSDHRKLLEKAVRFIASLQDPEKIEENLQEIFKRYSDGEGLPKFVVPSSKAFSGIIKKIEKQIAFEPDETVYFLYHDGADQMLLGRNSGFAFTSKNIYAYDITLRSKEFKKYAHDDVVMFEPYIDTFIRCKNNKEHIVFPVQVSDPALQEKYLNAINSAWELVKAMDGYKGGGKRTSPMLEVVADTRTQMPCETQEKKETAFCVYCGGKILRTTKFCNFCGKANVYKREES